MQSADQDSVLWKLERDGKSVACLVRLMPYGIEVDIAHDDVVVLTRAFETNDEALMWANKKRLAREAEGWHPVEVPVDESRKVT